LASSCQCRQAALRYARYPGKAASNQSEPKHHDLPATLLGIGHFYDVEREISDSEPELRSQTRQ
jgi:hypothetical protein